EHVGAVGELIDAADQPGALDEIVHLARRDRGECGRHEAWSTDHPETAAEVFAYRRVDRLGDAGRVVQRGDRFVSAAERLLARSLLLHRKRGGERRLNLGSAG